MINALRSYFDREPLTFLLLLGFLIRLVSVVFSTGYGMHDDHFLVIEAAQSWVDGYDYNDWLPENSRDGNPTGHSFFYVGLHYLFFSFCDFIGLSNPQVKMFFVRLFHALLSLLTILYGFKITKKLSTIENAKIVGLLLAVLWFYPILSVRNMVEVVCVPFVLMSIWFLIQENLRWKHFILAGLLMGVAVSVRMQTYLIFGGIGLILLFERKILGAIVFGIATAVAIFLTQITDLILWGYPFAEMLQYVLYNSTHSGDYITQSWYQYLLLIAGLLIPPVSLFLMFGYLRTWKKHALLFLPTLIFIVFHSMYPNKQERFILPVIPLIIILGIIGWREFYLNSTFWHKRETLYRGILKFFWILNIIALLFISPASSKKSRVDTMSYLSQLDDIGGLFLERTTNYGCYLMPRFYHGDWVLPRYCYSKNEIAEYEGIDLSEYLRERNINYCLFIEKEDIENRIEAMKLIFPEMVAIKEIEPSYMDKLFHFLNPVNQNETIYIYRLF